MVVRIEDARIEVEIDTRRAVGEVREIESNLERARARRRLGDSRLDPGRDVRVGTRRLGAAVTGLAAGRAVRGGLRKAIGLAARVGFGLTLGEIIRQTPAILPAILGEEGLRTQLIPELDLLPEVTLPQRIPIPAIDSLVFDVFGLDRLRGKKIFEGSEIEGVTVADVVRQLSEKIATIEATLKTTVTAATLAYDLLQEGKLVEAGMEAINEVRRAIAPSDKPGALGAESKDAPAGLGVLEAAGATLNAFQAYNTAEALFKQRAVSARLRGSIDNSLRVFGAGGGGVSR